MTDTAEIKEKRNEPLIIVSSNDKIDDENVFIEEINQNSKNEKDTVTSPPPPSTPTEEKNYAECNVDGDEEPVIDVVDNAVNDDAVEDEVDDEEEDDNGTDGGDEIVCQRRKKSSMVGISEAQALEMLDQNKMVDLKEAFTLFDLDGDGVITEEDLRNTFLTFGSDVNEQYIEDMLKETTGPMDFDAFVTMLGHRSVELDPEEVILEAMRYWDPENTGLLCEEDIRNRLICQGDQFTESEAFVALEEAPIAKGTGYGFHCEGPAMIDYREFCKILCGLRKKMENQ